MIKVLDCTLRDGGYYTNWDFDKDLVREYIKSVDQLPIEYIEIGYRSKPSNEYFGEYFYSPVITLRNIRRLTSKKVAIMINAKNVTTSDVKDLLTSAVEYISLVRIAVDPNKMDIGIELAREVKVLGFKVALNVMYISKIKKDSAFFAHLKGIEGRVNILNLVDSYGSIYPEGVEDLVRKIRLSTSVPIGFHGHNNLELAFANAIKAIDCGVEYIDSTVLGMGRGAGNLKTELILSYLKHKYFLEVDLNSLGRISDRFGQLHKNYKWGSNLAYIVSGIYTLPQKNVMDALEIDRYSLFGIVNQLKGEDGTALPVLTATSIGFQKCIMIGGGKKVVEHIDAILEFLKIHNDILIIHSTSKYVELFKSTRVVQYFAVAGEELSKIVDTPQIRKYILGPRPRKINIKIQNQEKFCELKDIDIIDKYIDSPLCVSLQAAKDLDINDIYLVGFDGYSDTKSKKDLYLMRETQEILDGFSKNCRLISLTPTIYRNVVKKSVYNSIFI